MKRTTLTDGREVHFKAATLRDVEAIVALYDQVYGGSYTLIEVKDPKVTRKKIEDPTYFWLLAFLEDRLIGSVIFTIDHVNKIGKAYAAVVLSEFRGQDIMRNMVLQGLERLTTRTRVCDVIYATTRTVTTAPQVVLEHCGFYPMGVFPNVRKVKSFETHGFEIFIQERGLNLRRKNPQLVPEMVDFYKIAQELLSLENHEECQLEMADPRKLGEPMKFSIHRDVEKIQKKFEDYQDRDLMDKVFFPFIEPNLLFVADDNSAEIFVNLNPADGNGVIVAYRIGDQDLRHILMWFCEAAAEDGMRYIELLVNAFRPDLQRIAIDAKFLPCAYFPAMRLTNNNQREDYIVLSRSFEQLDFMDMQLGPTNRRFLDAFMKCWYEMLVRCQPDFDEGWRIG